MTLPAEIYVREARTEPHLRPAGWSEHETPDSELYVRGDLIQEFLQNLIADAVLRELIPDLVQQVLDTFPETAGSMTFHSGGVVTLDPPSVPAMLDPHAGEVLVPKRKEDE